MALLLGVDRIMDAMRGATDLPGNCVAVFVVSRWEGVLDRVTARKVLNGEDVHVPEDRPGQVDTKDGQEQPAQSG